MNRPIFNADEAEQFITELHNKYRKLKSDKFNSDNANNESNNFIHSPEYHKFLGAEIALSEVGEYFGKFELGTPEQLAADLAELQELRRRDTPVAPYQDEYCEELDCYHLFCPVCNTVVGSWDNEDGDGIYKFNIFKSFCDECGQRIETRNIEFISTKSEAEAATEGGGQG